MRNQVPATTRDRDRLAAFWVKRVFDFAGALIGLILLSPLLAVVAVLVRSFMGSPVFFVQERPGLHGKPFRLIKFRTMTDAGSESGELLPDSQRLTGLGKFLRKTSLDEAPQLSNVLKGDLSLVGPRPLLMKYLDRYTRRQMRRHDVKPGITGWAQINGRNAITWEEKFELDVWYVENWSLLLDLRILVITAGLVLTGAGVSQPGSATAEEFMGSAIAGNGLDRPGEPTSAASAAEE
jgi:lipopolysaccharide/colanic/teichoic acid biosynthesis glycosyltransferase